MANKKNITEIVSLLCEAYGRQPSPATFLAFEIGLDGISDEAAKLASQAVLQRPGKFMPAPGEVRELALSNGRGFDATVTAAWQCFVDAIASVGYTRSPNFVDGLINATVRHLGGWERCCGLPCEEFEKWYRRDFERVYIGFLRNGCPAELCKPLIGAIERESPPYHGLPNPRSGAIYMLPAPVEIQAPYSPAVKSLPAPPREVRSLPAPRFKSPPQDDQASEPVEAGCRPKRMQRKHDFPKHLNWCEKADLEFELTPEQLETQERNRQAIEALTTPGVRTPQPA
jgi:hypothetical protein